MKKVRKPLYEKRLKPTKTVDQRRAEALASQPNPRAKTPEPSMKELTLVNKVNFTGTVFGLYYINSVCFARVNENDLKLKRTSILYKLSIKDLEEKPQEVSPVK